MADHVGTRAGVPDRQYTRVDPDNQLNRVDVIRKDFTRGIEYLFIRGQEIRSFFLVMTKGWSNRC